MGRQSIVPLRALSETGRHLHPPKLQSGRGGQRYGEDAPRGRCLAIYGTSFVDALVEPGIGNDTITAIIVENASGRQAITGKLFIEGSGTAQLAACAGVPFVSGGGPQPSTVDWDGQNRPIPGGLCGL